MSLRDEVKRILKEKNISREALCKKLKVSQPALSQFLNGNPTIETVKRIADALGVTASELMKTAPAPQPTKSNLRMLPPPEPVHPEGLNVEALRQALKVYDALLALNGVDLPADKRVLVISDLYVYCLRKGNADIKDVLRAVERHLK